MTTLESSAVKEAQAQAETKTPEVTVHVKPSDTLNPGIILMYGAPDLYPTDEVPGLHGHVYSQELLDKVASETKDFPESVKIPANTIIQSDTIGDLFAGVFRTGVTGKDAQKYGKDVLGIASTTKKVQIAGSSEITSVVNNEGMLKGSIGLCAGNDGKGRPIESEEEYAYLQAGNTDQTLVLDADLTFRNEHEVLAYFQNRAGVGKDTSLIIHIPGATAKKPGAIVKKAGINLKTIDGLNEDGTPRTTFRTVLAKHTQWQAETLTVNGKKIPNDGTMPDVAHVNTLNDKKEIIDAITIQKGTEIKFGIIHRVLVHDRDVPTVQEQKEHKTAASTSYTEIDGILYRDSKLHPDLQKKLQEGKDILGIPTTDANGKPLEGVALMLAWDKIETKAKEVGTNWLKYTREKEPYLTEEASALQRINFKKGATDDAPTRLVNTKKLINNREKVWTPEVIRGVIGEALVKNHKLEARENWTPEAFRTVIEEIKAKKANQQATQQNGGNPPETKQDGRGR